MPTETRSVVTKTNILTIPTEQYSQLQSIDWKQNDSIIVRLCVEAGTYYVERVAGVYHGYCLKLSTSTSAFKRIQSASRETLYRKFLSNPAVVFGLGVYLPTDSELALVPEGLSAPPP
jgi:hypothetical protein